MLKLIEKQRCEWRKPVCLTEVLFYHKSLWCRYVFEKITLFEESSKYITLFLRWSRELPLNLRNILFWQRDEVPHIFLQFLLRSLTNSSVSWNVGHITQQLIKWTSSLWLKATNWMVFKLIANRNVTSLIFEPNLWLGYNVTSAILIKSERVWSKASNIDVNAEITHVLRKTLGFLEEDKLSHNFRTDWDISVVLAASDSTTSVPWLYQCCALNTRVMSRK